MKYTYMDILLLAIDRKSALFTAGGDAGRYRKTISQFSSELVHASSFRERPTLLSGRSET